MGDGWLEWSIAALFFGILFCGCGYLTFLSYVYWRYGQYITRIFEAKPLFMVPQGTADPEAEEVAFTSTQGRRLAGSYLRHAGASRKGVIVFCHEFGASRWLAASYVGYLRPLGFDIFTFDFSNHGQSEAIKHYDPLQWVTAHEVNDVLAALNYVRGRPDADPRGVGLFGVSKGGGAGIAAAARDRSVRAVITDGAFPTCHTVTQYTIRWVTIYVNFKFIYRMLPRLFFDHLAIVSVVANQWRRKVVYPSLERAIRQLTGRPLFVIHGQRDNYINRDILDRWFAQASNPKELWVVPKAKHNGCLEIAGATYRQRVGAFFLTHLAGESSPATLEKATITHDTNQPPACTPVSENQAPMESATSPQTLVPPSDESPAPPGHTHESEMPDNNMPNNELPNNELPNNELPNNELPNNELPKNDALETDAPEMEAPDAHRNLDPIT